MKSEGKTKIVKRCSICCREYVMYNETTGWFYVVKSCERKYSCCIFQSNNPAFCWEDRKRTENLGI